MRLTLLLSYFLSSFFLTSCKKYKPAEEAFFLKPSLISVSTSSAQGSGSHKITDLALYVNGQFMGSYPSQNTMPVMSKGESVKINIQAGIKNNGISDTRIFWPFYSIFELDTFVPSGQTISIPVRFKYDSGVNFTWMEDFDSGTGFSVVRSAISDSNFTIVGPGESFEGRSLRMALSGNSLLAQVESSGSGFSIPRASANVYLEVNYKCNEEVVVGLIDESLQMRPVLHLNPRTSWNKVYVALADVVNQPYSPRYKVYFRMLKRESNPNPEFLLDNIKLLYL